MSTTPGSWTVHPAAPPVSAPPRASFVGRFLRGIFYLVATAALCLNILILLFVLSLMFLGGGLRLGDEPSLTERFHAGKKLSANKVAIVQIDGAIMEGMIGYARRQIDEAAKDDAVKAVVLRINSPGGSITASDDLHRRLRELRDGDPDKKTNPKPVVVSMASLAASGGYYIAMPARHVMAERTTITGSIGVFAAFPNVSKLANQYGVAMNVIKSGAMKDSGSMFHEMTPPERQLWQDMVDHAFRQFLGVVQEGRGKKLKYPLEAEIKEETKQLAGNPPTTYVRRLADGGIFTADKAKDYGLIDSIGYLDDALAEARKEAGLGDDYRAITYDRPLSLLNMLLEGQAPQPGRQFEPARLADALAPRLWYLMPGSQVSGLVAAAGGQ